MRASIPVFVLVLAGIRAPRAEAHFLPGPVKRAIAPVTKSIGKQTLRLAAHSNAKLDRMHASWADTHPKLAAAIERTRRATKPLSPLRLAGFAAKRVKDNPMLVPTYIGATVGFDAAKIAVAASMPPGIGGPVYVLAGIPQTVISLVAAEHATRSYSAAKGERPTMRDTLSELVAEYGKYNATEDRRVSHAIRTLGAK